MEGAFQLLTCLGLEIHRSTQGLGLGLDGLGRLPSFSEFSSLSPAYREKTTMECSRCKDVNSARQASELFANVKQEH